MAGMVSNTCLTQKGLKSLRAGYAMTNPNASADVPQWLHNLEDLARKYSAAKAKRTYLEHFRQSKLALLAARAEQEDPVRYKTAASRDEYARGHIEYVELLEGLKAAVEAEELSKWALKKREMQFEQWRSELSFAKANIPRNGYIT
jgi:hypothetical protein